MIALLNDGAILSIAYDNVHYKDKPEAWNMRLVLGVSTVLGVVGVVAAFGLFYLAERVFHLDRGQAQTMMYLKLSVAGHLTIFLTRTRGSFWSIRPARALWIAVLGTQIVATLIAVYGVFMTPLGWKWATFVWGYAFVWFLVNDRVKLLAYRILDPTKAPLLSREKADLSPQIAMQAYELYQARVRGENQADQDWLEAEREDSIKRLSSTPRQRVKAQRQADCYQAVLQIKEAVPQGFGRACQGTEFSAAVTLRVSSLCIAVDFPGYGCGRQGWRDPARNVGRQS
jgi:hypothetical protein